MFTGIVQVCGSLLEAFEDPSDYKIKIDSTGLPVQPARGDSVAVDGVCLTVEEAGTGWLEFHLSNETRTQTTLAQRSVGDLLNLEPALRISDLVGGHLVQGHVDGKGYLLARESSGEGWIFTLEVPDELLRYCVRKGSICINGISLTIASLDKQSIQVAVVPYTYRVTNLSELKVGDSVNLEADLISKYVARHVENLLSGYSG